ncbi:MAG TPA: OmpP1/FadL family transporter [Candidatus Duodenibacillus intestinavium]|nr:OmpP1/FadL family transporter [Candidatus Duodenibacillus intestinavium]
MTMKAAAAAVMAVCAASAAHAAGFMLTEQSAGALGRAYAGVGVDGTDLSGVYYNPATMTLHPGTQIQAGFVAVGLDLAFEGTGPNSDVSENGQYNTQAIPHGYISHQISDSMWVGLAMTVPFGMGTEYDDDWRFANRGISAEVLTFDFNPNVAWKVSDKLSLGAGMSIQYAAADLKMRADMPKGTVNPDYAVSANGEIDADSWAWGFNVGLMWSPLENLRFGVSYRSKINHHADGDFTLDNQKVHISDDFVMNMPGSSTFSDATASLSTPAWAMATAAWDVNELLSLYATFRWTDWSSFDNLEIKSAGIPLTGVQKITNEWQDTYLVSVGADFRFTNWWTFRAGVGYETSPIDNPRYRTAIIPDADRWWFALGSSFQATKSMQIDVSAAMLHGVGEGSVYASEESDTKVGHFENLDAYLFGVQLVYKF